MSDIREKAANEKFCSTCGAIILEKAEICPKCGVRQAVVSEKKTAVENASEKDWLTTLLLAIFVGGFGVHRFYVGKIGTGIIMLIVVLATFGIGAIWTLVDVILIATGSFKDKEGKLIVQK